MNICVYSVEVEDSCNEVEDYRLPNSWHVIVNRLRIYSNLSIDRQYHEASSQIAKVHDAL